MRSFVLVIGLFYLILRTCGNRNQTQKCMLSLGQFRHSKIQASPAGKRAASLAQKKLFSLQITLCGSFPHNLAYRLHCMVLSPQIQLIDCTVWCFHLKFSLKTALCGTFTQNFSLYTALCCAFIQILACRLHCMVLSPKIQPIDYTVWCFYSKISL